MALGPLLAILFLLVPGTRALTSARLPVTARTHTFKSYLQDPVFTPLVPVFVATALRLRGVYCQDEIKSLTGGAGLLLGPEGKKTRGQSLYKVMEVYQSPRRENRYQSIGTGVPDPFFAFKQEAGKVRLMVNMQALNQFYLPLSDATPGRLHWRKFQNDTKTRAAGRGKQNTGYYYDPSGLDGVSPYFPGLSPAHIRKLQCREQKQVRRDQRQDKLEARTRARYAKWVADQLGIHVEGPIPNITDAQLEQVYAYMNSTTHRRFQYKHAHSDGSGQYVSTFQRPQDGVSAGVAAVGKAEDAGGGVDEDQVEVENYSATSYIYDYAIIFAGPDGVLQRLDLTIVPKVFRRSTTHSGFLCKPDGSKDPVQLSSSLRDYIPRTATCAFHTTRAAPYALSSPDFAMLHPEEAVWLSSRLDKTAPLVKSFVSSKLPSKPPLDDTQARLRIGFSHMGGGKRAMFYSHGVTEALQKLGIFDQASWVSGLSGSAWYVTAHYAAMLDKNEPVSSKAVFDDIKHRANYTIWDDVFEGNEVLTDIVPFWGPAFHPSQLGDKNRTSEIFCEGELRLQWPNMSARGAASTLEYYSRAVAAQVFPSGWSDLEGLGMTFSSLVSSRLLATHSAPLPLYQSQENLGDGSNYSHFRLWEISPFDVATNDGDLHVSFPTALLGSRGQSTDTCTVGLDNIGYLQGISSYAFWFDQKTQRVCAASGSPGESPICRPTEVQNPFEGFAGVSSSDLYNKPYVLLTDGGWNCGHPMWMYLSPSRQADVVFVIDSGGGSIPEEPTLSTDTAPDPTTCPADASRIESGGCVPWPGTTCCRECFPVLSGCFSTNNVSKSYLFYTMEAYKDRMADNTLPPHPRQDGSNFNASDPKSQFGQRVLFFGCDNVSNKTPLVVIPNRIILSGQSGHGTEKGAMNVNIPFIPAPIYKLDDVDLIYANSEAGLPSLPGLPDFPKCIACLYYAKAMGQDNFMRTDPDCKACYDSYCWVPSSS